MNSLRQYFRKIRIKKLEVLEIKIKFKQDLKLINKDLDR
jgi:hypothetical protein